MYCHSTWHEKKTRLLIGVTPIGGLPYVNAPWRGFILPRPMGVVGDLLTRLVLKKYLQQHPPELFNPAMYYTLKEQQSCKFLSFNGKKIITLSYIQQIKARYRLGL